MNDEHDVGTGASTADEPERPHDVRQASGAQVFVADGAGGLRPVTDLRFDEGAWLVDLRVPAEKAAAWVSHLHAEIDERGWMASSFSQLHGLENSGTISVRTVAGSYPPGVDIVYGRFRDASLHIRARPAGEPPLSIEGVNAFVARIAERVTAGETARGHRRELLTYEGLPWRGELWLGANVRLGPPSRFAEALTGRQVLVLDAIVEGIGQRGIDSSFQRLVHGVTMFLGVVVGVHMTPVRWRQEWVPEVSEEGRITDVVLRTVGYAELEPVAGMPEAGAERPVERRDVERPGLGPLGIWPDMHERWVPADVDELWAAFASLSAEQRDQLMRAANAYLVASSMWPSQRTAYASFLVVACESLKPGGRRHDRENLYDVVERLLGKTEADNLRALPIPPQLVRSRFVHRGHLRAGELGPMLIHDYFMDPSFDETLQELSRVARTCLVEWLRLGGT
jgi:hypothetical protein